MFFLLQKESFMATTFDNCVDNFDCFLKENKDLAKILSNMEDSAKTFNDWRNVRYRAQRGSALYSLALKRMWIEAETLDQWFIVLHEAIGQENDTTNLALLKIGNLIKYGYAGNTEINKGTSANELCEIILIAVVTGNLPLDKIVEVIKAESKKASL